MNILLELLVYYQSRSEEYRNLTLLTDVVDDFLKDRSNKKCEYHCKSIKDVKENAVAILGLIGNPNLKTKKDLIEIDAIAHEIYEYASLPSPPPQPNNKQPKQIIYD